MINFRNRIFLLPNYPYLLSTSYSVLDTDGGLIKTIYKSVSPLSMGQLRSSGWNHSLLFKTPSHKKVFLKIKSIVLRPRERVTYVLLSRNRVCVFRCALFICDFFTFFILLHFCILRHHFNISFHNLFNIQNFWAYAPLAS